MAYKDAETRRAAHRAWWARSPKGLEGLRRRQVQEREGLKADPIAMAAHRAKRRAWYAARMTKRRAGQEG